MSKTVPFQTNQFNIQKQFYFKQCSIALADTLHVKTVLFQAIQIIVSTFSMSKAVSFQTNQFSIQKQFYFKRFSLALIDSLHSKQFYFKQFILEQVRSLNIKTVLTQVINFSISRHFIWELINFFFIYFGLFVLILVVFCCFFSQRFGQLSPLAFFR